ncbi:HAD family hydrolase [uncultured Tateyamaria sp.]|uniref:HAD family hydrolase n=1 Tax=uncultured Tateyamaria sp. TaxID=455651 RepID=UPI002639E8C1|nr:HAD family hydrolase [uncultured Tateyamaria sp.]
MTRHETFPTKTIAKKDFVLATDLDGTFLGGTEQERSNFYHWIEAHRERVGLIFVTGRDPGFIRELTTKRGVPCPDYVVGDVGTTIASVDADGLMCPISPLEAEIEDAWGDAGLRVRAALKHVRGLTLQSTGFRYRVSFDLDADTFDARALDIVADMGLDSLISDDRYFDVLPKGVSKGPSLMRLLAHLSIDHKRTLVAGDTMNDLSMLNLGLPAVAVGGSEPALIDALRDADHVHLAKGIGASGIAEAILSHSLFPAS